MVAVAKRQKITIITGVFFHGKTHKIFCKLQKYSRENSKWLFLFKPVNIPVSREKCTCRNPATSKPSSWHTGVSGALLHNPLGSLLKITPDHFHIEGLRVQMWNIPIIAQHCQWQQCLTGKLWQELMNSGQESTSGRDKPKKGLNNPCSGQYLRR